MPRLGIFARLLAFISPTWALSRMRAQRQLETHYDAAGGGRRTIGWNRAGGDANAVTPRTLRRLRQQSRDLVRNNPVGKAAKYQIALNTVGRGIMAQAISPSGDERIEDLADEIWTQWSTNIMADYDGNLEFAGIQNLVMRATAESGSVLVLRERGNSSDGLPVPVRIRVIEPDHLDDSRDTFGTETGNPIVKGIETDGRGRRVAYWIFPTHPETGRAWRTVSVRVPAEDVIHVFDVDRPGQMQGVPWMDAIITAIHDLGDFRDAQRMLQKIASCLVGVVEDTMGSGTAIGEQDPLIDTLEYMEPGQFAYLRPGQSVKFNAPPPAQNGEVVTDSIREIAVALGLPTEILSGDYTAATFSSIRAARQQFRLMIDHWRKNMLIPKLCDGVWRWVMEMAAGLNGWSEVPKAKWIAPPLPSIEPDKEPKQFREELRTVLKTPSQALMERGVPDFAGHIRRAARDWDQIRALGLVLDSDPAATTGAGIKQADAMEAE